MAVVPSTTYLYCDASLNQFYVQGEELIDRGPWSSSTSYTYPDVVQIGLDQYVAIASNTNAPPTAIVDENWSQLVVVEEATIVPSNGSDAVARALAAEALAVGSEALTISSTAYTTAQAGSNMAWTAWELAQTGTNLITAETGSRIAADAALTAFVFGSIGVDLVAETGSRIAADSALQTEITTETGSRIAADDALIAFVFGSIAVDLATETGSRITADAYEAGTRAQADQALANVAYPALSTANAAYGVAQVGTAVASQGYGIAVSGSTTANAALALAQTLNLIVSAGSSGTNVFFVAQAPNSDRSDIQITVVAGVMTNIVGSRYQYEDFGLYSLGIVGQGTGDLGLYTSWNGSGVIFNSDTLLKLTGSDAYSSSFYGTGTNTTGVYAGGQGWGGASGVIVQPFVMQVAFDSIQTYALGTVIPGQLSAGTGWASAAILTQY